MEITDRIVGGVMYRRRNRVHKSLVGVRREIHGDFAPGAIDSRDLDVQRHFAVRASGVAGEFVPPSTETETTLGVVIPIPPEIISRDSLAL